DHTAVCWPRFLAAFEKEWGPHPDEAYGRFKKAIVSPSASLPSLPVRSLPTGEGGTEVPGVERGGEGVGEGMVAIEVYDRLT
ncbi:hypothetical protein NGA_0379800, partial [Nannochloropsis gaditana CCMP526]|uniref:uncharacterized protein n=1 Tax=Nannochloropsis gaditana (strain CCMP526) TaxID=1093141 RepID=UPI00029F5453